MGWKTISIQTEKVKDERLETYIKSIGDLCEQECYSKALERIEEAEKLTEANNDNAKVVLCLVKCNVYVSGSMTWKAYSGLSQYSQKIKLLSVLLTIHSIKDSSGSDRESYIKLLKYMVSEVIDDTNAEIEAGVNRTTLLLIVACQLKQKDVVEILLKHGANPHKKVKVDGYWIDAFRVACASPDCDVDVARLLIKYGANVNERYESYNNGTCLHQIAKLSKHWEPPCPSIYRMLVEAGANVNLQDDDGYTPAMLSLDHNWFWSPELDMLNYLLSHGARENVRAKNGRTLLDLYKKHDIVDK